MVVIEKIDVCVRLRTVRKINAIKIASMFPRENNLSSNPYVDNSVTEVAMRRKAEILQYAPSTQSSQTNSDTKNQSFSRTMTSRQVGPSSYSASSVKNVTSRAITLTDQCTNLAESSAPMPASRSNVPGNLLLYNDKSVVLYTFGNHMLSRR